jgi:translation initiation factor eIF-2B subunit delta
MPPKPAADDTKKLSAKELKEKKKAEKAARREQNKAAGSSGPPATPSKSPKQQQLQQKGSKKPAQDGPVTTIRLGIGAPSKAVAAAAATAAKEEPAEPKYHGLVGLLKELESEQNEKKKKPQQFGIDVAHPDVHPAILTLGMLINKREIVGSTARCLGFLLAIKRVGSPRSGEGRDADLTRLQVIEDYETPEGSSLNRHLPAAYLSHQINYLTSARPMATAMGSTIRWLKAKISNISPDITDEVAKRHLINAIENFIHERITAAGDVIVNTACERYIEDHDVILVFSKSQIVEKTLLEAKRRGKQFRVVVVDSRPLEEGRNLLACLCENNIEAEYVHIYALDYAMQDATKVFLGANAVMLDGALYSRAGTAVVALAAQAKTVPVLVLCETIKFCEKINIDGIVLNELGAIIPLPRVAHMLTCNG